MAQNGTPRDNHDTDEEAQSFTTEEDYIFDGSGINFMHPSAISDRDARDILYDDE